MLEPFFSAMEKVESKYGEVDQTGESPVVDFSSEFARFMKSRTVARKNFRISDVFAHEIERSSEHAKDLTGSISKNLGSSFSKKKLLSHLERISLKIFPRSSTLKQLSVKSNASERVRTFLSLAFSTMVYAVMEILKIPRETIKVLDEFSYLPMWVTMPVIFVSSVVLGAVFSVFVGL